MNRASRGLFEMNATPILVRIDTFSSIPPPFAFGCPLSILLSLQILTLLITCVNVSI
jgi:hypothetical protein